MNRIVFSALFAIGTSLLGCNAQAYPEKVTGCPHVVSSSIIKIELTTIISHEVGGWVLRDGEFKVTNLGTEPIELGGIKSNGRFDIDFPDAWEGIEISANGDALGGVNGAAGVFSKAPDRIAITPHGIEYFTTSIEPMLSFWPPNTQFHIIVHTFDQKACVISSSFTLTPRKLAASSSRTATR